MNKPIDRQTGFSLLEILVSSVVVLLLATSVFYFIHSQNGIGMRNGDTLKSVNAGKLKMDSLKVAAYGELTSGADTVSDRYIRAWHVSRLVDGAGLPTGIKQIDMNVMWPLSAEHSISFASLRSDDRFKEGR
ncbi:MAG: hypothetical protein JWP91_56 [Fibrobacteres bacterium]|nr:hypothetical protein [Fibrobacterota bacterium]